VEQILLGQLRFDPSKRRRFSKRGFVSQDSFPETLAFFEISTVVLDNGQDRLASWKQVYREEVLKKYAPEPEPLQKETENEHFENEDSGRPLAPWERFTKPTRKNGDKKRSEGGAKSRRKRRPAGKKPSQPTEGSGTVAASSPEKNREVHAETASVASPKKRSRRRRRRPGKKKTATESAS